MQAILKKDSGRITVAEVKRLIVEALPNIEVVGYSVYERDLPNGETELITKPSTESESVSHFLNTDFLKICQALDFEPHLRHSPARFGYNGIQAWEDGEYMLTHAQFVRLAESYSLAVTIGTRPTAPEPQGTATNTATAAGASGVLKPPAVPTWSLKPSIQRAPGYRWPLYQTLKAAYIDGLPCPKARDVLDTWTLKPPPDLQVMPDGVKYNNHLGKQKEADLKAIGQAIKNLLVKPVSRISAAQPPNALDKRRTSRTT